MIPFHAANRRVDHFNVAPALLDHALANARNGLLTGILIADNAAFADVKPSCLELRLNEDYDRTLPSL